MQDVQQSLQSLLLAILRRAVAGVRPWKTMVHRFSIPKRVLVEKRVLQNLRCFAANYIAFLACMASLLLLFNPLLAISLTPVFAAWLYLAYIRKLPVIIASKVVTPKQKHAAAAVVSVLVVLYLGRVLSVLIVSIACAAIIAAHATLHTPNPKLMEELDDPTEDMGGGVHTLPPHTGMVVVVVVVIAMHAMQPTNNAGKH